MPVFLREHRSRLYRTDAYFLGKSLAEFPLFMLVPLLFTAIAYPMVGLRPTASNFGIALAIIVLVANVSTSFGKRHCLYNMFTGQANIKEISNFPLQVI